MTVATVPGITVPKISTCILKARELEKAAKDLVQKKLPIATITRTSYPALYKSDVYPLLEKVTAFSSKLRPQALSAVDNLKHKDRNQADQLNQDLVNLDAAMRSLFVRLSVLQSQSGVDPVPVEKQPKSWVSKNPGWTFTGLAATLAVSQLTPSDYTDPIANFSFGKFITLSGGVHQVTPLRYPLLALRAYLGPDKATALGCAALGAACLYPTYRVLKPLTLKASSLLDKGITWLNKHPLTTLASSMGLTYLGARLIPDFPVEYQEVAAIAGGFGTVATTFLAEELFTEIKKYYNKEEDELPMPAKPAVPPAAKPVAKPPAQIAQQQQADDDSDDDLQIAVRPALPQPAPAPALPQPVVLAPAVPSKTLAQRYADAKLMLVEYPKSSFSAIGAGVGTAAAVGFTLPVLTTAATLGVLGLGIGKLVQTVDEDLQRKRSK